MKLIFITVVTLSLVYLRAAEGGGWQGYVDDQLVGTGHIKEGAIAGFDGSIWANSPTFQISPEEVKEIVQLFRVPSTVFATGVTVAKIKYMGIKGDERSIYGKKGAGGVVLVKTGQAIIIGIYDETMQPGNAALAVEKLGDYLRDNGH